MHLHDINPHVLNSLYCLIGIAICLGLIIWGAYCDRRQMRLESRQEEPRASRSIHRRPRRLPSEAPRYRQVA